MNLNSTPSVADRCRRWSIPRCWQFLFLLDIFLLMFWVAGVHSQEPEPPQMPEVTGTRTVFHLPGPNDVAADEERFEALDVYINSGETSLAAYQFELTSRTPGMEIAGIEGGEHPAFRDPPWYDPRAISHNRVILAAFHTGRDVPTGRSRVARVHVLLRGPGEREYETRLTASATVGGQRIPAEISVVPADRTQK